MASGETLLGIDFRPANGLLYVLGDKGNVYRLDHYLNGSNTLRQLVRFLNEHYQYQNFRAA